MEPVCTCGRAKFVMNQYSGEVEFHNNKQQAQIFLCKFPVGCQEAWPISFLFAVDCLPMLLPMEGWPNGYLPPSEYCNKGLKDLLGDVMNSGMPGFGI